MSAHPGVPLIWHTPGIYRFHDRYLLLSLWQGKPEFMADEFFPNTFHSVPQVGQFRSSSGRESISSQERDIFKRSACVRRAFRLCFGTVMSSGSSCFDVGICFLLGFIKKIQLTIDIFPFFTGSTKELLREIFNLLTKIFFFQTACFQCFL